VRNSASLEGGDAALVKLRLARGPVAPSSEVPPRSRAWRPFERDSASLGGWTPPSSEVSSRSRAERPLERISVSLEGITGPPPPYMLPRQEGLMHRHSQAPRSKANPRHDALGNHAPTLLRQLLRRGHPRHCVTLCHMASNNPVALCHPLPYDRRAAPSKKDGGAVEGKANDYAAPTQGQRRDVGPAGPVTSVSIDPVRPSPPSPTPSRPLHHHPRRCGSVR
jgi:hypothetical protein